MKTPAPWQIAHYGNYIEVQGADTSPGKAHQVCRIVRLDDEGAMDDARLIAAAPTMRQLLHDLIVENDQFGGIPQSSNTLPLVRSILAETE